MIGGRTFRNRTRPYALVDRRARETGPEGFERVGRGEATSVVRDWMLERGRSWDEARRFAAEVADELGPWTLFRGPLPEGTQVRADIVDLQDLSALAPEELQEPTVYWAEVQFEGDDGEPLEPFELEVELPDGKKLTRRMSSARPFRLDGLSKSGDVVLMWPEGEQAVS